MHCSYYFVIFCFLLTEINTGKGDLNSDILKEEEKAQTLSYTRKRRYVVFPEGSSFSLALSLDEDASIYPIPNSRGSTIFTTGVAWAISYDLPNETIHTKNDGNKFSSLIQKHKRDLFVKAEKLMNFVGLEGEICILKTICEAAAKLSPKHGVLEEILRLIFTYPEAKINNKSKSNTMYTKAHQNGELNKNCDVLYPCPLSLLELGLGFGKYPLV